MPRVRAMKNLEVRQQKMGLSLFPIEREQIRYCGLLVNLAFGEH